jgi:hypothetical protein
MVTTIIKILEMIDNNDDTENYNGNHEDSDDRNDDQS